METTVREAFALHQAGDLDAAEAGYRRALAVDADHLNALQLLAVITLDRGHAEEAVTLLQRALALYARTPAAGNAAPLYNNLANALSHLGRFDEAVAQYEKSIALAPDCAETYFNLGNAHLKRGDVSATIAGYKAACARADKPAWHHQLAQFYAKHGFLDEAEASYRAALAIDPHFPAALYDLGTFLNLHRNNPQEATEVLARLLHADPDHADVYWAIANVHRSASNFVQAIAAYRRHLERAPQASLAHIYLGLTLADTGRFDEGIASIMRGIDADAANAAVGHLEIGNVLLRAHRVEEARRHFLEAYRLQPFFTLSAKTRTPSFAALFLFAPTLANTPYLYLVGQENYDAHFVPILQDTAYDIAALRERCSVVVNLISDADQDAHVLSLADDVSTRLQKPTINQPQAIALTDRCAVARRVSHVPHCRVANVHRFKGAALLADPLPAAMTAFAFPLLVRVAGGHGGDAFEKVSDIVELRAVVGPGPDLDYYVMDYIDYRSADGFFRKYRFFCVDGALLPYHLAIDRQWKVHQFRTDLMNSKWLQDEEEAFLRMPSAVFGSAQMAALGGIVRAIDLDFFGIDCALDCDGKVVVFEANATMLVNGNTRELPYREPYVRAIKKAFNTMLAERAMRQK